MKIGLIGAGRLGICLALLIERAGYDVLVSDIRDDYVSDLNEKKINTNEPDVEWYLRQTKKFEATTDNQRVINECDIIICLVATPSLDDGSYDISSVWQVVEDFKKSSAKLSGKTLVVGCTTNPGDCEQFAEQLDYFGVDVLYNPEFIAQGSIIKDLQTADMVLIGGNGKHLDDIKKIYHAIQVNVPTIHTMSTTAAELVKLAVNCFLTTKITYANMVGEVMALSGHETEIDSVLVLLVLTVVLVLSISSLDMDTVVLVSLEITEHLLPYANKLGLQYNLGSTTDKFNTEHNKFLVDWVIRNNEKNLPFAFPYVSYKEGTDIVEESQQYRLCLVLLDLGYKVYVADDLVKDKCDDRIIWGVPDEEVFWIEL